MIKLTHSIKASKTPAFETILKQDIESLDINALPLQEGLTQSSNVGGDKFSVVILNVSNTTGTIRVKTGIFYSGIISGCSCADDPTPQNEITEYCEVQFDIDVQTAAAVITLLPLI